MSATIPPFGGPKWTITVEHGDVHITVRQALVPNEADQFIAEAKAATRAARRYCDKAVALWDQTSPITQRSGS